MNEKILIIDVFKLRANCSILKKVDKIIICCKRSIVRKLVHNVVLNGKLIRKDSIIKQQSALLHRTCLYLFVDKYVDSGTIDYYFWLVNRAHDMTNVKCTIKGTNNSLRKATLRRLLNQRCRYYVESDSSSDGSTSS